MSLTHNKSGSSLAHLSVEAVGPLVSIALLLGKDILFSVIYPYILIIFILKTAFAL